MLNTLIVKGRRASNGEVITERTLALTFPTRDGIEGDSTELTYEDLKENFGGETPAQVLRNIFNYAIETKMAEK